MNVDKRRAALQRGVRAERLVASEMVRSGWTIVDRNWRAKRGELDIVAQKQGRLRFVEVRQRPTFEEGLESVSLVKQRRLIRAAEAWLCTHSEDFDEVCFSLAVVVADMDPSIRWVDNPFDGV